MKAPLPFRSLVRELRLALRDCPTVLEVGCGTNSPMQYLAQEHRIEGLDIYEPSLKECMAKGFLKKGHLGSAMDIDRLFPEKSFDALVALDLIEHLPKADGFQLIEKMTRVARRRIVIFTPNGFVPQHDDANPWQEHLSGWQMAEFQKLGFRVIGLNGYKALRGERAMLRHRPKFFWGMVSEISHYVLTKRHPDYAFALFCVKQIGV